jgi:hypothetical protein
MLAFRDLIRKITELKNNFFKNFYGVVCHNIKKYNFAL